MASIAFSFRSLPTWGPTISRRRMSTGLPVAVSRLRFSREVKSALVSIASVRSRNSFSRASPMLCTDTFSMLMARSPSRILSIATGPENLTWTMEPPAKSTP